MRLNRKVIVPLATVATLMSLVACSSSGGSADSPASSTPTKAASLTDLKLAEPVDLKVGLSNPSYSIYGAMIIAQEMGVFEDFGLNVTFQSISATDALPLLARGDLDVMEATFGAGFLNGINQGLDVRCIATTKIPPADTGEALYARAGLFADPQHPTAAELKGKTLGLGGGPTSTSVYSADVFFNEEFGLRITDFNLVQMAAAEQLVALTNGAIDVGYLTAPLYRETASRGITRLGPLVTPAQCTQVGPRLVKDTDVAAAFLAAVEYANEKYLGPGHLDNDEVVNAIAKGLQLDPSVIRDSDPAEFKVRALEPSVIEGAQDVFRMLGVLDYDTNLPYDEVFDSAAVDRLP